MNAAAAYTHNQENFAAFYALQGEFVRRLATHPGVIRDWLAAQPERQLREGMEPVKPSRTWRAARLTVGRRRELAALLRRAEEDAAAAESLAILLLAALPVCAYLEMASLARPSLRVIDPQANALCGQLARLREDLFLGNYGLAQNAARRRNFKDPSDLLSAASCGLLDAIDRYVPGGKSARFSFFASFWIRYHLSRHTQKFGSVVSFPVNQHRIGNRIDRYLEARQVSGLPTPSEAELCADLCLGPDAYFCHQLKPQMLSFENYASEDTHAAPERYLCDPAPGPAAALEEAEIASQLRSLLRASAPPAVRVMLAYMRNVGSLADAAGDYLAQLHEMATEKIQPLARASLGPGLFAITSAPVFGTACDPAFRVKTAASGP